MKLLRSFFFSALAATLPFTVAAGEGASASKPNSNLDLARQLNQAFVQVAESVTPSVVVITVIPRARPSRFNPTEGSGNDGTPMDELRRFMRQLPQEPTPDNMTEEGSGIIIRENGFILTNGHVVDDADKIEVRLKDGRTFKATVRGMDPPSDVAVIKIDATGLPVAKLADSSKTRVGEFAIAIGAPFALDYSVTFGHVSAKDRSNIPTGDFESPTMSDQSFIQTDANINPGNSGGPLVNIDSEVIGVNTLIRGLRTGIGFAIPSNLAREVSDQLIATGKYPRTWLGIVISSLRENTEFRTLIPGVEDGVIVREILLNGPLAKSDLQAADVITAVDGKTVVTSQQLKEEIRTKKAGQDVSLSVFRQSEGQGKRLKVVVRPGEWTAPPPQQFTQTNPPVEESPENALGLVVGPVRRRSGMEGVMVIRVQPGSLAARSALQPGDIITSVGGQTVRTPNEFYEAAKKADPKKGVILNYNSRGTAKYELLKQGAD
jgi:serine protease Do